MNRHHPQPQHPQVQSLATAVLAAFAACAAGVSINAAANDTAQVAIAGLHPAGSEPKAQPSFHLAPATLQEPSHVDADGAGLSAYMAPAVHAVPSALAGVSSARLTPEAIAAHLQTTAGNHAAPLSGYGAPLGGNGAPLSGAATPNTIVTYTPAQIRAAYGLPALPAAGSRLTAAQAASLGSGQTIYIIDAFNHPNVAADLGLFNSRFGLPACTNLAIGPTTKLPLAAPAAGAGCTLSVVYAGANGLPTSTAPAYDSGWAVEIAMDVQWAHATAPMARIVLIEAAGATLSQLAAAIQLANHMGPGVVSMSFGGGEGSWMSAYEPLFTQAGSSYIASTGDAGAGVSWPSNSPNVLGVGGTTLTYTGTGARKEVVWAGTGGGLSAYFAEPSYQTAVTVPGEPSAAASKRRGVADVAFNADPYTGQFLVVTPPGTSSPQWYSAGGTSIGSPQWAGMLAIVNAERAQVAKSPIGLSQNLLYRTIATNRGMYTGAFLDVNSGRDGSCGTCGAGTGYDLPTGLGTPNANSLLGLLSSY